MTAPTTPAEPLVTPEAVLGAMSTPDTPEARAAVAGVVAAVNSLVPAAPYGTGWLTLPADGHWAPHHRYGAAMLAARLERRKDAPGGLAAFGADVAGTISGNWPDIALLLQLGSYTRPTVG